MTDEEIKKLLEENLALTREVRDLSAKTAKYIRWVRVMDLVKVALVIIPIIAAWLYLPDLLSSFKEGYGDILPAGLLK